MVTKKIPRLNKKLPRPKVGQFGSVRFGSREFYAWESVPQFVEWYDCRDSFHYNYARTKRREFFYARPLESVRVLVRMLERKLNLSWINRTRIHATDIKGVCWVVPGRFWRRCPMRMSFFTLILQATAFAGLDEAMIHDHQCHNTEQSIYFFLNGNCRYKGVETGWYKQFDGRLLAHHNLTPADLLAPTTKAYEVRLELAAMFGKHEVRS